MAATRSTPASEVWRSLLIAFTGVHRQLEVEMEDKVGLPIEHYEVLLMLYEAGGDGMRPSEVAERRRLSRSGATRLVDRLEKEGLVERRSCGTDRRGSLVALTTAGRRTFTRAGRVHLDGIERHVGRRLAPQEMTDLRRLLSKLVTTNHP